MMTVMMLNLWSFRANKISWQDKCTHSKNGSVSSIPLLLCPMIQHFLICQSWLEGLKASLTPQYTTVLVHACFEIPEMKVMKEFSFLTIRRDCLLIWLLVIVSKRQLAKMGNIISVCYWAFISGPTLNPAFIFTAGWVNALLSDTAVALHMCRHKANFVKMLVWQDWKSWIRSKRSDFIQKINYL